MRIVDMRTPLARVKGAGGLPDGVEHWEAERVSAVMLAPLSLWAAFSMLRLAGRDREAIVAWAGRPLNAALLAALIGLVTRHMQLGLDVVTTDYVRGWKRSAVKLAIRFASLVLAAYGGASIVRLLVERSGKNG
ncbi:succinate dehydrogenase, hydrophobic membrane anchor protein [Acidomonas methanolica]|uniref:succinate dehydrogenase, hydrophobic membrane anchor protein n=1 Tax=Acidomonas methanolica TaxID=437 RepID=UPI002119F223|nr:succinate dehydrogenase, hydrophobic membrane anchor protein [Acidomonas methanolica]MCQ9156594.1 succinate dehydrogenase, hydrophobic membrane anchor protein [Acidomonas methanolica]